MLDKHTAELIAAGEVVERPASVVKELTENAIDAGATAVSVSVERGGIAMIQIADNGCGIEAEYIPTAFIRHATSKIEKEEDLESIHTLGFRGEALASVASVSRIELLTKTDADEYAYLYRISGGEEQGIEPAARPVGTTITVRDLFYNTPARMKFLKRIPVKATMWQMLSHSLRSPTRRFRSSSCGTENRSSRRPATENCWGRRMPCFPVILQRTLCLWSTRRAATRCAALLRRRKAPVQAAPCSIFYQWTLCQEPHDDGGAGGRL